MLKVDVQGADLDVLQGGQDLLALSVGSPSQGDFAAQQKFC
ncbi:hypothetical protein [uncultured Thermosynechococcus sp.]